MPLLVAIWGFEPQPSDRKSDVLTTLLYRHIKNKKGENLPFLKYPCDLTLLAMTVHSLYFYNTTHEQPQILKNIAKSYKVTHIPFHINFLAGIHSLRAISNNVTLFILNSPCELIKSTYFSRIRLLSYTLWQPLLQSNYF